MEILGRKGQAALEYLLIVAFAFAVILPGVFFFYNYTQNTQSQAKAAQVQAIGQDILFKAKKSYGLGKNTWLTVEVKIPESVKDIRIEPTGSEKARELVIDYQTGRGVSEAVFFSDIDLKSGHSEGKLSKEVTPGIATFEILSKGSYVVVNESTK